MPLNEADTRAQLIDPKLNIAGWTRSHVTREQFYRTDWAYAAGRVVLRGDRAERLPPRRVDYVLRYTDAVADGTVGNRANCVACRLAILSIGTRCKCKCGRCHFHSVR